MSPGRNYRTFPIYPIVGVLQCGTLLRHITHEDGPEDPYVHLNNRRSTRHPKKRQPK